MLETKATTLRLGLCVAKRLDYDEMDIEKALFHIVLNVKDLPWEVETLVMDIIQFLPHFVSCNLKWYRRESNYLANCFVEYSARHPHANKEESLRTRTKTTRQLKVLEKDCSGGWEQYLILSFTSFMLMLGGFTRSCGM